MNDCQKALVFMLNDYTVLHLNLVAKIAINASGEETVGFIDTATQA